VSLVCTLAALFALGIVKGRVARQHLLRAGIQVLLIGGVSASVGWIIGHVVTKAVG
jgi:VIT1/CCC1 family predicted Fe2+/Mn2+ transporter